jgi:serine/threonine protein kinase
MPDPDHDDLEAPPPQPDATDPHGVVVPMKNQEPTPHPSSPPSSRPTAGHYAPELPLPEELQAMIGSGYVVESFLGHGGMGAVYKGLQMPLRRPVAIKILAKRSQDVADDFAFEERFKREAYAMAALTHPNIVRVYDCGDAGDQYLFISMELVEGGDLSDAIKGGKCTPEVALKLIPQICDALQVAHEQGIVHRDIKPANIFLTADGRAKVADFGLAKRFDAKNTLVTKAGMGMGTPDYAAPEQYEAAADLDHRADIYSLGVMMYQMLTGKLPRGSRFKSPSELVGVDPRIDAIIAKAMSGDREDRHQTVAEIKAEIAQMQTPAVKASAAPGPRAASPTRPHSQPRLQTHTQVPATPPKKSNAGLIAVVAAAVAVLGAVAFLLLKPDAPVPSASTPETRTSEADKPRPTPAPVAMKATPKPQAPKATSTPAPPPPQRTLPQSPAPVPGMWKDMLAEHRAKQIEIGKFEEVGGAYRVTNTTGISSSGPSNVIIRAVVENAAGLQIIARNKREARMYRLRLQGGARPHARIEAFENPTQLTLRELDGVSFPAGFDLTKVHEYQFAAIGDTLRGWVDGTLFLEGRDSELTSGNVSMYCPKGLLLRKIEYGDLDAASSTTPVAATPAPTPAPPPSPAPATPPAPRVATPATQSVPATPRLAQLEAGFKGRFEAEAQKPYLAAVASLNQNYVNSGIARARTAAQQKGILAEVTALDAEKARIEKGEPLPPADLDTLPESLKSLRTLYRSEMARYEAERDRKAAPLYDIYLRALDLYIAELTKDNKIDEAKQVTALRADIAAQKPKTEADTAAVATTPAPRPGVNRIETKSAPADDGSSLSGGRGSRWYDAASWVISVGGLLRVEKNGAETFVDRESEIPPGRFRVLDVTLNTGPKAAAIKDADFTRFAGLPELRTFRLYGIKVTDDAFEFLSATPDLQDLGIADAPVTDAVLAHIAPLGKLTSLQIQGSSQFTGAGLEKLASLPVLKLVTFARTGFTDAGAKALLGAKSLENLQMGITRVTDDGLAGLSALPKLNKFNVTSPGVKGAFLAKWGHTPALRELALSNCPLNAGVIAEIGRFTNLTELSLDTVSVVNDAALASLAPLTKLDYLSVGATAVTGAGFTALRGCKTLQVLRVHDDTPVSKEGLAVIVGTFPALRELVLGKGAQLDAAAFGSLAGLNSLKILSISMPPLDDAALAEIGKISSLENLSTQGAAITVKGLLPLKTLKSLIKLAVPICKGIDDTAVPVFIKDFKHLKELDLRQTSVTPAGLADLKKGLPSCRIQSP